LVSTGINQPEFAPSCWENAGSPCAQGIGFLRTELPTIPLPTRHRCPVATQCLRVIEGLGRRLAPAGIPRIDGLYPARSSCSPWPARPKETRERPIACARTTPARCRVHAVLRQPHDHHRDFRAAAASRSYPAQRRPAAIRIDHIIECRRHRSTPIANARHSLAGLLRPASAPSFASLR